MSYNDGIKVVSLINKLDMPSSPFRTHTSCGKITKNNSNFILKNPMKETVLCKSSAVSRKFLFEMKRMGLVI